VVLMLLCLAVQAGTGLFANDDASFEGPLAGRVSKATSDFITHIHHLNLNLLYLLVAVHLAAVLFYLVKKGENLVHPMVTGYKQWTGTSEEGAGGSGVTALILAVIAAGAVYLIIR
jgi:cytochrome b